MLQPTVLMSSQDQGVACEPEEPLSEGMCVGCLVAKLRRSVQSFPRGWQRWEVTRQAHRFLLEEAVQQAPPYPGGHEGRGIVVCAGGDKYFACAMVVVGVLRQLGCQLPVEMWYLGPAELDPQMRRLAEDRGVQCIDAWEVARCHPVRILNGWELKPYAIIHSRFREVLFLDADNVPVLDPTFLFDDSEYQDKGAIFWPDVPQAALYARLRRWNNGASAVFWPDLDGVVPFWPDVAGTFPY